MRRVTLKTTDTLGGQVVVLSDLDREMLATLPAAERISLSVSCSMILRLLSRKPSKYSELSAFELTAVHRN